LHRQKLSSSGFKLVELIEAIALIGSFVCIVPPALQQQKKLTAALEAGEHSAAEMAALVDFTQINSRKNSSFRN
jgi:hypothetical protein